MRPARALIDLQSLRHNYRIARELAGGRSLAVVKADAYGHGAVRCAQALEAEAADGFAVACLEEALALRGAGIRSPILLLEGFFEADELPVIAAHDLWCVIHAEWQIAALEQASLERPLRIWLKLDSGMHRVGLAPQDYRAAWQRLTALPQVASVVAMTHFARADELDSERTQQQVEAFAATLDDLPGERSLCNSPGLLGWPAAGSDWGRAGLMLYGANPFPSSHPQAGRLRPVMTAESKIISVRELAAGEPIGYGGGFVTERPTRVGVVAFGYADGYPHFAPTGTPVAIDGQRSRLIGRVSMDMLTVDLTDLPQASLGSRVELWGAQVPVTELARHANGSAYSLLCGLKRAPRIYRD